jgi:hypothetical protein
MVSQLFPLLHVEAVRVVEDRRFLLEKVGMAVAKAPPPLIQRALPGLNHLSSGSTLQTSKKMKTTLNKITCVA